MKYNFVLIIYILFSIGVHAQELQLQIFAAQSQEKPVDSLITLGPFKNYNQVHAASDSLITHLQKQGYFQLLAQPIVKTKPNLFEQGLILGARTTHARVRFLYTQNSKIEAVSLSRKREQIYPISNLDSLLQTESDRLYAAGYSFHEIELAAISGKTDTLKLDYQIKLDKQRQLNRIVIKGYDDFPVKVLGRQLNRNRVFNDKTVNRVTDIIENLPFVTQSRPPEALFKKDSTLLYLYLDKKNANAVEGMLGFNSREDGNLELNGFIDLQLHNNLNAAERFYLTYRNDTGEQSLFNSQLEIPYLFKSNLGTQAQLNILRRDSTYQNTRIKTGLFYKPNWKTQYGISYENLVSTATDETNTTTESLSSNGIVLDFEYSNLNLSDKLMPERLVVSSQIGYRERNILEETQNQLFFHATFSGLWHLTNKSSVFTHVQGRYLDSENIRFNELYQFGGSGSIRGFAQNSIDSSKYGTLWTEYRYRLNDQIYLHSILDYGVFESFSDKKLENIYGFGVGMGILTRAGILKIGIANGQFQEANVDFSSTIAHINLRILF